ncbi:MAG: bifunctional uridylyltransferase/uridylyl-removing enzyme [Candidatus Hydrogenedentota bacterium]
MTKTFEQWIELAESGTATNGGLPREELLHATRQYSARRREEIRRLHAAGASGGNVVRLLSNTADVVVRGVFQFALSTLELERAVHSRVALCALGGYGRGELSPFSDLDICLLYEGQLDEHVRALNGYLIPFLWDSGFLVGYSIHSVREASDLASEDMLTLTRFLESRILTGENSVFARLKLHIRELQAGAAANQFIEQKVRDRYESLSPELRDLFAAEPNVKENAGGLRDFHTALWLLMASYGVSTLDEAVAQGVLTADEHLDFVDALDFLWRIRNELHFHAGKADDRLTFANQRHVAAAFAYMPGPSLSRFMQDYYAAAGQLRRFLRIAVRTCSAAPVSLPDAGMPVAQDYVIENGELYVGAGDERWFTHSPTRLMEVFWLCARHMVPLSRPVELLVRANLDLINDAFRGNDVVRRFFIAICNRPLQAGHALRQAAALGVLGRYLPEFRDVENIIRYEDFHSYPVGEHTLRAIEALAGIHEISGPVGRCLREAIENLSDPYILVIAILLHDLGKVSGDIHIEESVRLARQICARIGIAAGDQERIVFLVQHHSLMTTISQYRDIDDDHIVKSFAETMQNEYRLRALFLLSYADLAAVRPGVWSEWKGALLLQLYLRTVKRLMGRAESVDEEYWASPKAEAVRAAADDRIKGLVDEHLRGLGQRYFVAYQPEQMAQHLDCVEEAKATGLAMRCTENDVTGRSEVVICTKDRHGLFSMIAGCFSSQLIDISGAALFTRPDGWVVDCFTVADARHMRPLTAAQAAKMEEVLRRVLLEEEDVQDLVDRATRRLFALLQPRTPVPTRITFDNNSSRRHTIIDIETGDRTGLLYDITRAMSETGLDIVTARIVTDAHRVRDSFYVTHEQRKIEDEEVMAAVREAIHSAIHPRAASEARGGRI